MTEYDRQYWRTQSMNPETQETQVNETQELPAVSKLREAFDTARNALIEGSELAKQVETLSQSVDSLQSKVASLTRDLEYVHNRNRELDEQVTQVRRSRDEAIADASEQRSRAESAEQDDKAKQGLIDDLNIDLSNAYDRLANVVKERDDAMGMALEYESKLKAAEAKLTKIEEVFGTGSGQGNAEVKPKPHYLDQPRDEVGKFQPTTYDRGSQSEGSGF